MNRRPAGALLAAVVALTAGACTATSPPPTTGSSSPPAKETPVQTRTLADATTQADTDARQVAATLGNPLDGWQITTLPCTSSNGADAPDRAWQLQGAANITVTAADQITTLQNLAQTWQQQGWQITDQQTFADNTRATVSALNPATGTSITVTTTKDLGRVAVVLASSCYLPAPGEDPANG